MEGVDVVHLGGAGQLQLNVAQARVLRVDEGEIDVDHPADAGIGEPLGDLQFLPVGGMAELLAEGSLVVLTVGVLHVGDGLGAFGDQVHAATQEVAGGPHASRIDIGLRQSAAA